MHAHDIPGRKGTNLFLYAQINLAFFFILKDFYHYFVIFLRKIAYSTTSPLSVAADAEVIRTWINSPICLPLRGKITVLY